MFSANLFTRKAYNPTRKATLAEQTVFWQRWSYQKKGSLLGHLKKKARDTNRASTAREVIIRDRGTRFKENVKAFPVDAIVQMLRDGFTGRPPHRHWTILRDQMITLLLHFGGRRISEPLQMWIGDVEPHPDDPTRCIPWICHPTDSEVDYLNPQTGSVRRLKRQAYLKLQYGITPLIHRTGNRRVGWKNPMTTSDKRIRVFWSDTSADRLFWMLYRQYVIKRPKITRHPFLFITRNGDPMTTKGFTKVHAAAVRRIGLVPAKYLGTTPHGHRHAYGNLAEERKVGQKSIQVALGHSSPVSQEIYKNKSNEAIAEEMLSGENQLAALKITGV